MTPFDRFLALFDRLKDEAGGDPERMAVFYSQKRDLKQAADDLAQYVTWGDFKRRVLHSGRKWHDAVPDRFLEEWDDFEAHWDRKLFHLWLPLDLSSLGTTDESEKQTAARAARMAGPSDFEEGEPPDDWDTSFDPSFHDGGKALDRAFWAAQELSDEVGSEHESALARASSVGLEAWDYMENTIGFSADEVFRRWRKVPVIYVPEHVSKQHGWPGSGSIYQLLDDAVRAYVFGAPAAAIAMCRAVLEMVLKDHYGIVDRRTGRHEREPRLGELIVLADAKYDFIQGDRLRRLSDRANTILHSFRTREPLSTADDQVIIEFMKTLKFLIQRAPEK